MSNEWVEVRRCMWLHEAQLFKSVLAGALIEARIPDEYSFGVQAVGANFLEGVRLLVRSEDAARAREVLDSGVEVPRDSLDEGSNTDNF